MVTNYGGILGGGAVPTTGSGIVQTGQSGITQSRQGDTFTNNTTTGTTRRRSSGGGGGSSRPSTKTINATNTIQQAMMESNKVAQVTQQLRDAGTFTPDSLARIVGVSDPADVLKRQQANKQLQFLQSQASSLEQSGNNLSNMVSSFNSRYGGRQLTQSEYNQAVAEQAQIDAESKRLATQAELLQSQTNRFNLQQQKESKYTSPLTINQQTQQPIQPGQKGYQELGLPQTPQRQKGRIPDTIGLAKENKIIITDKESLRRYQEFDEQIFPALQESLIDAPSRLGKEAKRQAIDLVGEPKGTIENIGVTGLAIPLAGIQIGKNLIGGIAYTITRPTEVMNETYKEITTKPLGFGTSLAINLLAFKGAGQLVSKTSGLITTAGAKYIPRANLTIPKVISGEKAFPEAKSVTDAIKKFNKESYKSATGKNVVYSASDYPFRPFIDRKITITSGRGLEKSVDVPGLYTSTRGVSEYFLRIKQGIGEYKLLPTSWKDILPGQPKIFAIRELPTRIPKAFRSSLEKAQSYFGKNGLVLGKPKGVPGKPYYSPALEFGLKREAEAVIQVGSTLERTGLTTLPQKIRGFRQYTIIDGVRVPIYEMKSVGAGKVVKDSLKLSVKDYASYSSGVRPNVIVSPKNVLSISKSVPKSIKSVSFSSVKPSVSSMVSEKSSISSVGSYKPSTLSSISKSSVSSSGSRISSSGSSISSGLSEISSSASSISSSGVVSVPSYKPLSYKPQSYIPKKYTSYKVPTYKPPIVPPPTYKLPKIYPKISSLVSKNKLSKAFDVFVRKKGKKILVGSKLPFGRATSLGRKITGETTARSFVVVPKGFTNISDVKTPGLFQYRTPKFGGSVQKAGFEFVEKSRFAIDTVGEKSELKAGKLQGVFKY